MEWNGLVTSWPSAPFLYVTLCVWHAPFSATRVHVGAAEKLGASVGSDVTVGAIVGSGVGGIDGALVAVGPGVGSADGAGVGAGDGAGVGTSLGAPGQSSMPHAALAARSRLFGQYWQSKSNCELPHTSSPHATHALVAAPTSSS